MNFELVPLYGLCNKMRAIASVAKIASDRNRKLKVYWLKNDECGAYFHELFDDLCDCNCDIVVKDCESLPSFVDFRLKHWHAINKLYPHVLNSFRPSQDEINICSEKGGLIYTCQSLGEHYPLAELFRPKKELMDKIKNVSICDASKTIGVHIRRTDHDIAMSKSTLAKFKSRIGEELTRDASCLFYLATDDETVKKELISDFKNSIITYEGELRRDTLVGMQDAVIDLWCLSRTKSILGSYFSSYSALAAELGNVKLEIVE